MPYNTEVIQSVPYNLNPVGQKYIVGLSNELCVANEQNVKFCFDVRIFEDTISTNYINVGVFKTTPNNAGVGILDISNLIENYVSSDNTATEDSKYKILGGNGRPIPIHLIDKYSRNEKSNRQITVVGFTEFTDNTGTVQQTSSVTVVLGHLINTYVKESNVLKFTLDSPVGDAYSFGFSLEDFAIQLSTTNKFLTNAPSELYAKATDYGTLSFIAISFFDGVAADDVSYYQIDMYDGGKSTLGSLQIDKTQNNGAYDTISTGGLLSANRMLYLGAFPANLKVNDTFNTYLDNGEMTYYTIGLYNDGIKASQPASLISEVKTINILCPNTKGYESVRLTWLNQYGTWDYFTFDQKSVKKTKTKGSTYQQLGGSWNSDHYEPYGYKGGKKTFRVNATETITINTDYLTEEHSDWFEDLVNSPEVYILKKWQSPRRITQASHSSVILPTTNQYLTPVRITSTSFTKKTIANDRLIQYTFEIEKSRTLNTQSI
tara:strand:- start:2809 stop:4278 length:1470 start_codon:yes stop_codon:yes gene_type:complete